METVCEKNETKEQPKKYHHHRVLKKINKQTKKRQKESPKRIRWEMFVSHLWASGSGSDLAWFQLLWRSDIGFMGKN